MFKNYLKNIGLENLVKKLNQIELNNYLDEVLSEKAKTDFSENDIENLYSYKVPKISENGSCSTSKEAEKEKHNLCNNYKIDFDYEELSNSKTTTRLWILKKLNEKVKSDIECAWLGIYRKIEDKPEYLLKESYFGEFSRAEFPLTKEFAETSNNSTVGLNGKAIIVNNVEDYDGPYYQCDAKVNSEFCCPIIDSNNKIIGIIDAEDFKKEFFTDKKILQIAKVCFDLGEKDLLI